MSTKPLRVVGPSRLDIDGELLLAVSADDVELFDRCAAEAPSFLRAAN